jgi:ribosome-associated toxin RatA of RatAB toxin-antitoxin module
MFRFACLLLILTSPLCWSQQKWVQEKHVDNIRAYSRMKEGRDFYEYRTVFTVNAPLSKASNLLFDVANFKNWLPNCLESKVVRKENEDVLIGYTVTDAPWPSTDRDVAFKVTRKRISANCVTLTMESRSDYFPEQKGLVRVREYQAVWKITETESNLLEIEYIASFNPGSSTPNWVIKNSIIDARIESSKNFIREVKKK